MRHAESVIVGAQGERELLMTRAFDAPRKLVFDAFTKPELVQRWLLGPEGWTMPVCEIDLRVGGRYRFVWRRERDGSEMGMSGVYREIVAPERIVSTERFDEPWYPGEAVGTLVFVEQDGRTTVTQTMLYESRAARDSVLASPMEQGVEASYIRLDEILATTGRHPSPGGYEERPMKRITPFLWFDGNAEEAMNFYVSVFENSLVVRVHRRGGGDGASKGAVTSVEFQLEGQEFLALNGGPHFKFSPAISLFVSCETQAEVDELWEKLSAGGERQRCGWLRDRYGLSWQIIPSVLGKLLHDEDPVKAQRVMAAMLQMEKLDIGALERAYASAEG